MNPSSCSECGARVVTYNAAIAAWAPGKSTTTSPITVVDCWTGFNTATDTGDGVHPNDSGNQKLAKCWYEPLKAAISAAGGSPTTSTVSVSRTSSTSTAGPTTSVSRTATTTTRSVTPSTTRASTTSSGSGGGAPLWGQCGE
jgi:hypothetical protein